MNNLVEYSLREVKLISWTIEDWIEIWNMLKLLMDNDHSSYSNNDKGIDKEDYYTSEEGLSAEVLKGL